MARVKYECGEVDPNHKVVEGIRTTLANSHRGRARTTVDAINMLDIEDEGGTESVDLKIAYICRSLGCTHERVENEVIFKR